MSSAFNIILINNLVKRNICMGNHEYKETDTFKFRAVVRVSYPVLYTQDVPKNRKSSDDFKISFIKLIINHFNRINIVMIRIYQENWWYSFVTLQLLKFGFIR